MSDACDLPLSTAYRKLDLLTDADLLEGRTRLRRSGRHASEYVRRVEGVVASFDAPEGFDLQPRPREPDRSGPDASASCTSGASGGD